MTKNEPQKEIEKNYSQEHSVYSQQILVKNT